MPDPAHTIARADLDENGRALVIDWGDGLHSVYPLAFLRVNCPCATCRDVRDQAKASATDPFRVLPGQLLQPNAELVGVEPVGRYGMRFVWGDRHDTGIYTFEFLRELAESPEVAGTRCG